MIVTIKHTIANPDEFWKRAQASLPNLPKGLKVHAVMPESSMKNAICVWESETLEQLKGYIEKEVGDISKNEFMVVHEPAAMGIPKAG